ncbi:MAG: beta-propeller fold lactonase family protein [Salinibacterium sp.]|nr:beta-propeller fold lactonase family protein [Salinibacterium sp.]
MTNWWVGGYGHDMGGTMSGIQSMRSTDAGTLELVGTAVEALSPSYLLQRGEHVYAVAEGAGTVDSFRISGEHTLVRDGSASSGGTWPCNLEVIGDGIAVANYFDGVVALVGLDDDGAVTALRDSVQGAGSGPNERQQGPHAHTVLAVDEETLLSVDLGADRIVVHRPGLEVAASVALPPGTGPRDIVRHPSGLYYALSELSHELFVLRWIGSTLEVVSSAAVPGALDGDNDSGISLWGNYVYTGLRGSNRIATLRASDDGAQVEPVGWVSSEGEWPRHHAVDGDMLHVANEHSNSVASFRLAEDGTPRLIGEPTAVPSPNYLLARS